MNRLIMPLVSNPGNRAFSLALLLVFLARALIPMGYMPTLNPGQPAKFALTLCVSGLSTAAIQVLNLDPDHDQSAFPDSHCAFSSALGKTGPPSPFVTSLAFDLFARVAPHMARDTVVFSRLVRGPPLGSRAPPVYRPV